MCRWRVDAVQVWSVTASLLGAAEEGAEPAGLGDECQLLETRPAGPNSLPAVCARPRCMKHFSILSPIAVQSKGTSCCSGAAAHVVIMLN